MNHKTETATRQNKIYNELVDLKIVDPGSVYKFYPKVRDRDDVGVLRCAKSGVIFLDRSDHVDFSYYAEKEGVSYWSKGDRDMALRETWEDDKRRADQISSLVTNKIYADVGSGLGGILDLIKPYAKEIHAVEPQKEIRETLIKLGYPVLSSIDAMASGSARFDFVTLFHVFEHLTEPLESLKKIYASMAPGGKIFIEVPHANDALISSYNLEAFKKFTFWSEHLVLHTRKSLEIFLQEAGFKNISVSGFQRFPLANHLYWLRYGESSGHLKFPQFRDKNAEAEYASLLSRIDQNDTIIAIAEKA